MIALTRAELLKLLATRRTVLGFGLAMLALAGIGAAATVDSARDSSPVDVNQALRDVLADGAGTAVFISVLLGVLVSTWEYQHRTMTHTLLAAPLRERVVGAKGVVALATGAVLAAVSTVVALAIAVPWLGNGASSELGDGDVLAGIGRLVLSAGLWCCLGVAIGALVASQVGGMAATLLWLLVAEPIIGGLLDDVGPYLPGGAMRSLIGATDADLSFAAGLGITLAYVIGFGALGVLATIRRDIT
jgi:ABC-2 type transport system permease protein